MTNAIPATPPGGAAFLQALGRTLMDVILHLGAHRTATTTFQRYMQDQMTYLSAQGVAYWGPVRTRKSVFPGLFRNSTAPKGRNVTRRASGRIRMFSAQAQASEVRQLVISDENMLGTCIQNIRAGRLYPAAGERTARISAAFGGRVRRIVLSIRAQDLWWASACALTVGRGHLVPAAARLDAIASSPRGWRDVITDLACAAPGAQIEVLPFETVTGRPDLLLSAALDREVPPDTRGHWLNRSLDTRDLRARVLEGGGNADLLPDAQGRWQPFNTQQAAMLRENYADDLHWLKAGADGLARLTQDMRPQRADLSLPPVTRTKGQGHDQGHPQGDMAQHRREGAARAKR